MKKPSLWFPVKPWIVSQSWGIKNPSYEQFGFSRHNGVDCLTGFKNEVRAPIDMEVSETGYNDGAGNYVRAFTTEKYQVGDKECYIGLMFMHAEKVSCVKGQILRVGDLVMIADSTGFSTGPHTHITTKRFSEKKWDKKHLLDTDTSVDRTFDPTPYWNGYYAVDKGTVLSTLQALILLLQKLHKVQ